MPPFRLLPKRYVTFLLPIGIGCFAGIACSVVMVLSFCGMFLVLTAAAVSSSLTAVYVHWECTQVQNGKEEDITESR